MIHSTTAPIPILLIRQYQSYWYDTIHYCPYTRPTYMIQYIITSVPILLMYTTVALPVLLILHSPFLSQYQSTDTVQSTNSPTSPNDTTQSMSVAVLVLLIWYNLPLPSTTDTTAHFCPSISPADMKQSTTAPIQDKLCTALYQSYWYLTDTSSSDIQQSTTALILVLLILYNPRLPQYMSYWYDTIHYCPSTNPI